MKAVKSIAKFSVKSFIAIVIASILAVAVLLAAIITNSYFTGRKHAQWQKNHIEELQAKYSQNYIPLDEQKFAAFNIEKNLDTPLNKLQFMGTHNSYKLEASAISKLVNKFTAGVIEGKEDTSIYDYIFEPVSDQLNNGIRSFELDVLARTNGDFVCSHHAIFDNASSCLNFELAVKELKLWSDANPDHLPVTVLVELKDWLLPVPGTKDFDTETMRALDKIIYETAGENLFRPEDMLDGNETLQQALDLNGWPTLKELRGKIIFLLHPDSITQEYISSDMSMQSQSFFPMLGGDSKVTGTDIKKNEKPWQDNVIMYMYNSPFAQLKSIQALKNANYFVRTRSDSYREISDDNVAASFESGANIISSDYPEFSGGGTMMNSGIKLKISSKYTVALTD